VTGKAGRDALKVALGVLEEIAHGGDEMLRRAA